jgi:hypothetical protein
MKVLHHPHISSSFATGREYIPIKYMSVENFYTTSTIIMSFGAGAVVAQHLIAGWSISLMFNGYVIRPNV